MNDSTKLSDAELKDLNIYCTKSIDAYHDNFVLMDWFLNLPQEYHDLLNQLILEESRTNVYHPQLESIFEACIFKTYDVSSVGSYASSKLRFLFTDIFRFVYLSVCGIIVLERYEFDLNQSVHVVQEDNFPKLTTTRTYSITESGKSYIKTEFIDKSNLKEAYLSLSSNALYG